MTDFQTPADEFAYLHQRIMHLEGLRYHRTAAQNDELKRRRQRLRQLRAQEKGALTQGTIFSK